jgi:hypothetical protein
MERAYSEGTRPRDFRQDGSAAIAAVVASTTVLPPGT